MLKRLFPLYTQDVGGSNPSPPTIRSSAQLLCPLPPYLTHVSSYGTSPSKTHRNSAPAFATIGGRGGQSHATKRIDYQGHRHNPAGNRRNLVPARSGRSPRQFYVRQLPLGSYRRRHGNCGARADVYHSEIVLT